MSLSFNWFKRYQQLRARFYVTAEFTIESKIVRWI